MDLVQHLMIRHARPPCVVSAEFAGERVLNPRDVIALSGELCQELAKSANIKTSSSKRANAGSTWPVEWRFGSPPWNLPAGVT